ncbi:pectinesterase 2-like [Cucurbita pepo subsp. pepo]|uniref:pectinesterase 2-like n=1 Tax=Cucurbita pepo subsp. pepo TaxID=3664 RepID=UPI000C9D95E1|nr:pectinesterase 2-like [Cucurbita pepo subsp. pepo]
MAVIHSRWILIVLVVLNFPAAIFSYSEKELKNWCSQTPYPAPCEQFIKAKATAKHSPIATKSHFLKLLVETALDGAVSAQKTALSLGPKCHNGREKSALTDCVDLYNQIISRLNRSADRCSSVDAQTWLSASLTALDTCRNSLQELGVSAFGYPLTSNNVSKLISDGLSVNKPTSPQGFEPTMTEGFPTWVRPGDRKLLQSGSPSADVVVAKDGSGNFKTVKEAVAAAKGGGRFVIYVKAGVYSENLEINAKNLMLIGDGIGKTVITGSRSVGGGFTTFRSATVAVDGDGFIARDITFRNTAGAANHQAVALRSGSDLSVFYRCGFEGYQDTLYVYAERQFYKQCDIYGTVDFIFGNAAVVLQDCNIIARDPPNRTITVTAQGRSDPNQNTGISIHNSRITSAGGLSGVKAYLGRPWRQYSRTVIMKSSIGGFISPAGWLEWSGSFALNTLYYGEYMNTGPGASTANRVKWKGYRVITSATEASKFTVGNFIAGGSWLPSTGVPFTSGL